MGDFHPLLYAGLSRRFPNVPYSFPGIFDRSEHIEIYPPNTVEVMEGEKDEAEEPGSATGP